MAAADAGAKALLDGLTALGRAEDTIVVLLSDHGENLYDEPGRAWDTAITWKAISRCGCRC